MVEQESDSMAQHLPKQPARQMPQVARPHPLYGVALCKLREDGVYPVAKTAQECASFGVGISFLGGIWGQKPYAHTRQVFCGLWRMVVAVSYNDDPGGKLDELRHGGELVGVGGGHRDAGDHSRPPEPNMHPEAVEGLPQQRVLAEGRFSFEAMAAVGASKEARRKRQRVADSKGWVMGSVAQKLLPEALLYLPEVRSLPGEGGAMHFGEGGELLTVMAPEVPKDPLIGVDTEELAYTSMVRTSASESLGREPRPLRALSSIRLSMRQNTAMMKVLRSTARDLLRFDWFGHHRA
jgi:hypothetical protein